MSHNPKDPEVLNEMAAVAKLEEMGYTMWGEDEMVLLGWSIHDEGDGSTWSVRAIYRNSLTNEIGHMTLDNGFDTPVDAASELVKIMFKEGWH